MALVLPLLFFIVFGLFEVGYACLIDSIVENAAYEGARSGVVPGATEDTTQAAAEDLAYGSGLNSVNVEQTITEIRPNVRELTVTVSASMNENAILAGRFLGDMTISRSVSMILESDLRFRFPPTKRSYSAPIPRPRGRGNRLKAD